MLRQPRTGEDEQTEDIVFYLWAQVRFVRQTDSETMPS
jgi:hypothetical protein